MGLQIIFEQSLRFVLSNVLVQHFGPRIDAAGKKEMALIKINIIIMKIYLSIIILVFRSPKSLTLEKLCSYPT
jgi:hypothetical protein